MRNRDTVEEYWNFETVKEAASCAKQESILEFRELLAKYVGVKNLFLTPSARWGIRWILSAIVRNKGNAGRVLVPAYNCRVVADAIRQSGNRIEAYDFSSPGGAVRWESVAEQLYHKRDRPIALIIGHFFGVPVDFTKIKSLCKEMGVYIIEDCAHTLGGTVGEKTAGSLGDASVFSFNYDKPISLGWGGALALANEELLDVWTDINHLVPSVDYEFSALKSFLAHIQHRRDMIGAKESIPQKMLRKLGFSSHVEFVMPALSIGPLRACIGKMLLEQYDKVLKRRMVNAQNIIDSARGYATWYVAPEVRPAWLKQRVQVLPKDATKWICQDLQKKGYRVGNFNWPIPIGDPNKYPNSRDSAKYWIDVPIHQNITQQEIDEIIFHLNRSFTYHGVRMPARP